MHSSRRSGPVTDLHNAHTVSTLMRAMTTSNLSPQRSHRHSSRSKITFDGTYPVRSSSIHQIENRDRDYERHHRTFDNVRSADILSLEIKLKSNEKVIAHQNAQIEFLHETNRTLERQLQELTDLKRDLSNKQFEERLKNDDLLRDLQDIDRLARKVQADKQYTVDAADRELTEAKMEIEQNHREMQTLDTRVAHLTTEKKSLIEDLETMKSQYTECNNELLRLQDIVDRLQADKGKLSRRVSKLVHNEKDLLQELQRSRRTTKTPTPSVTGGSLSKKLSLPARLDIHLKNTEDERDMYKNEVEILQKLLNDRSRCASSSSPSRLRGRSLSPTAAIRSAVRRDMATSPVMQFVKRSASSSSASPTRCTVCGINRHKLSSTKDNNSYESQLRSLEEERDRFRRELHKHKRSSKDKDSNEPQLSKVLREKEDLQLLLNKFERHMAEIQGNIKVLTNERDNINMLYEQAKEELQKSRHEILQNIQTPKVSIAAQSILRKVESERDSAIVEARTAGTERDSLRERLRITTDTGLTERARNEQRIEDLEIDIRKLENDREEILRENHLLREQIRDLTNKLDERSFTISQLNQELDDQKNASAQLRYLSEEAERLVQENQRQLNLKKDELRTHEDKINRLEKKIYELQETNKAVKDDFHIVRQTVQTLDKEKERLCNVIDLKSEENQRLTQELNSKIRRIEELNRIVAELEVELDRSNDDAKQKLKELSNMRIQFDRNLEELNDYRRKFDIGSRDNKHLQDDLSSLRRENQTLHQELEHAIDDKENLKLQVQEYIKQVSSCESIITQKENDRATLIEQYREASTELSRAKMTLTDIESRANDLKQEVQIKSTDVKRLLDRIDCLERDVHHHASVSQEYEIQLSNMTRSTQRNEEIIKKLQSDKQNLLNELTNSRDHNSSIESKREQIIRQLTSTEHENDQLQAANSDMNAEIDMLRTQISNEKAVVQSLEELINSLREKEFQAQIHVKERDSELHVAKDRASINELKVHTQSKEIAALRTQIIGLESDNKRLKHLLTNERHEKDMATQDLRKLTDLTSHIDYESRHRSTSPRITTSASNTSIHRSPGRSYSPHSDSSPTKISISLKVTEVDDNCETNPDTEGR
ncbi:unnamed protein product [Adineta steineri]|uniref:Uncharacterized protein n=1 Tax=Adineta steineri TaxID=433720 RepID=A0A813MCG6_9BILA|nr:unnamed protein product [Adineta steineri]CAF3539024.1 unnamed protein product [Adineta steineri]